MKYSIKLLGDNSDTSTPYELTLTVENKEEQRIVHDQITIRIAQSGAFVGDIFCAGKRMPPNCGTVPLRPDNEIGTCPECRGEQFVRDGYGSDLYRRCRCSPSSSPYTSR